MQEVYIGIIILGLGLRSMIQEKNPGKIVEFFAFDSTALKFYINNSEVVMVPRDY